MSLRNQIQIPCLCTQIWQIKPVLILSAVCLQAVWTRFFPVSVEVRKMLAQGEIGEVKMVRSEFGVPVLHNRRVVEKELGGGALLNIGMYCLQFVCMVYNGERPESIQATGVCLDTGRS